MQIAPITLHAAPLRRATSAAKTRARSDGDERNRARCSTCNMRELCLPGGLTEDQMTAFSDTVYTHKRVKRGDALYRLGEEFSAIYAVRAGFFKASVVLEDGPPVPMSRSCDGWFEVVTPCAAQSRYYKG